MSDARTQLAALRRKLASLESRRDVLGAEAVEQARAALNARIQASSVLWTSPSAGAWARPRKC